MVRDKVGLKLVEDLPEGEAASFQRSCPLGASHMPGRGKEVADLTWVFHNFLQ